MMHDSRYDSVRFFATLLIVIHHFITTCNENSIPVFRAAETINLRLEMGGVGVGMFFTLSGALLWKGNKKELSVKEFYRKRANRILIPYWIATVILLPLVYLGTPGVFQNILKCGAGNIISFLGLYYTISFWNQLGIKPGIMIAGEWFTTVIIILYCLYPILNWLFKRRRITATVFITIIFLINLSLEILTYHDGYFSLTNGLMYFWLGMLFEEYKNKLNNNIGIISWIAIVVLFFVKPEKMFGVAYLHCFFLSIAAFIYFYYLNVDGHFSKYICRYNYEIYLLHHRIFLIFMPLFLNQDSNSVRLVVCFVTLVVFIFILSEKLQKTSNWIEVHVSKLISSKL